MLVFYPGNRFTNCVCVVICYLCGRWQNSIGENPYWNENEHVFTVHPASYIGDTEWRNGGKRFHLILLRQGQFACILRFAVPNLYRYTSPEVLLLQHYRVATLQVRPDSAHQHWGILSRLSVIFPSGLSQFTQFNPFTSPLAQLKHHFVLFRSTEIGFRTKYIKWSKFFFFVFSY